MKTVEFKAKNRVWGVLESYEYSGPDNYNHSGTYVLASEAEAEIEKLRGEYQALALHEDAVHESLRIMQNEMIEHAGMLLCEKHSNYWGEFHSCPCCRAESAESKLTEAAKREKELNHVVDHMVRESGKQIERERVLMEALERYVSKFGNCGEVYQEARAALAQVKGG